MASNSTMKLCVAVEDAVFGWAAGVLFGTLDHPDSVITCHDASL